MISLRVSDVRKCMNELLRENTFDFFLLQEATVNTEAAFSIDGHRNDDFFTAEELEEIGKEDSLIPYGQVREHIFNVIKGKKTPSSFQIILSLPKSTIVQIITGAELGFRPDSANLVAMIRFVSGALTITTGTSFSEFTMDKSLETEFDKWVSNFLTAVGIDFDKLT